MHRFVWLRTYGELPMPPLVIRHLCGHGHCFNPRHLASGTQRENVEDERRHGTLQLGESHHNAKLTEEQVREIRQSALGLRRLAEIYGVRPETIHKIRTYRAWKHVA
jgi:HNH endonuclease